MESETGRCFVSDGVNSTGRRRTPQELIHTGRDIQHGSTRPRKRLLVINYTCGSCQQNTPNPYTTGNATSHYNQAVCPQKCWLSSERFKGRKNPRNSTNSRYFPPPYHASEPHREVPGPNAVVQNVRNRLQQHHQPRRERQRLPGQLSRVRQVAQLRPSLRRRARARSPPVAFIIGDGGGGPVSSAATREVCSDNCSGVLGVGAASVGVVGEFPVSRAARLQDLSFDKSKKRCPEVCRHVRKALQGAWARRGASERKEAAAEVYVCVCVWSAPYYGCCVVVVYG